MPTNDSLVQALKICCAALSSMPEIDGRYTPEHRTVQALAFVTAQAGIAMAEGRPLDVQNTDLVRMLAAARDAIEYMLPRVDLNRAGALDMRRAERALIDLTRLVGPGPVERRIQAWVDAYAGVEPPRQSADVTPADVELYSHR